MYEEMITAAELRNLGCVIAARIPDCAEVPRSMVVYSGPSDAAMSDEGVFTCKINVRVRGRFRWVENDITVDA